jgi:GMP synthase (glutamine-hydrolysing)
VRVPVIDNGGQWTHREYRVLRDLGAETDILPNTATRAELGEVDGIVLSGGALSLEGTEAPLGAVGSWIDSVGVPVLGICVGHHFLARHFGGRVARAGSPEFGRVPLQVQEPGSPLFVGLPSGFTVWANHSDEVTELPPRWRLLASSPSCRVQAMAHPDRPIFGTQFHPEVEHTEGGRKIFENFLATCARPPVERK